MRELPRAQRPDRRARHTRRWRWGSEALIPSATPQAIRYHYDVGNDFYSLWLDAHMVYSCAYFRAADDDDRRGAGAEARIHLPQATLKPGERLLDIGCGWGGLISYAAEHYGVEALGITLSEPQAELASETDSPRPGWRNAAAWRSAITATSRTDAASTRSPSVGMVEHVGWSACRSTLGAVYRVLRPGGLFLNHGIVRASGGALDGAARSAGAVALEAGSVPPEVRLSRRRLGPPRR